MFALLLISLSVPNEKPFALKEVMTWLFVTSITAGSSKASPLKGRFKYWHNQNYFHLKSTSQKFKIPKKNKKLMNDFYAARKLGNPLIRIYKIFFKSKIRRQTIQGNILFIIAILLKKV